MTHSLSGAMVGVSISEPPDLVRLGLGEIHIRHAYIEAARHVLAAGGSLAYGGDLRPGGYTEALFDLVRAYEREERPGSDKVRDYLPWPLWEHVSPAERAPLMKVATIVEVPPPAGAPAALRPPGERDVRERLWFVQALVSMRKRMTSDISARIVLGGGVSGQSGLCAGVLDEAALALQAGVPLFVIGGFGGCGGLIAEALSGVQPSELTTEYQLATTRGYDELLAAARVEGGFMEPDDAAHEVASRGWTGLGNGLDEMENRRLAATDDVDEVIALVLRGLRRVV